MSIKADIKMRDSGLGSPTNEPAEKNGLRDAWTWIATVYFLCVTIIILPIDLLAYFGLIYPIKFYSKPLYLNLRKYMGFLGNFQFVTCAKAMGVRVNVYGDNLDDVKDSKCIFLINHLGLMDHFIFMTATNYLGADVVGKWMFVIYNVWIYSPLGLLWYIHGNYFVNISSPTSRAKDLLKLKKYFDKFYHENEMKWVCLYPEGSRLYLIKGINSEFERKNGLVSLDHCAYPRLGATLNILKSIGPNRENPAISNNGNGAPLKYLVDVTLGYPDNIVYGIDECAKEYVRSGIVREISINFSFIEIDPCWNVEENLKAFLFELYQKKDKVLEDFYKSGKFAGEGRVADVPPTHLMLFVQIAIISVFYLLAKLFGLIFF